MTYKVLLALFLAGCTNAPDAAVNCSTVNEQGAEIWLNCSNSLCEDGDCTPLTDEEIQQFEEEQPREDYQEGGA